MKALAIVILAAIIAASAMATDTFRVHYNVLGSGRDISVQAESSDEARRTVQDVIAGAVVMGVHRINRISKTK
jgi:hypothetical protein